MLDRLQYAKQRFDEISDLIIQPDVIADQKQLILMQLQRAQCQPQCPLTQSPWPSGMREVSA